MFLTKRTQQLLLTHRCFPVFYDRLYLRQQNKLRERAAEMVGKAIRLQKLFSCFGRKSSCARVLVIISAWAQRVFHDFIFQACSGGWKTSRNPTRVQSIPPLSKLAGFLCRAVICPRIHQLLLWNPILPLSWSARGGTKRQKGTNKKRKRRTEGGKRSYSSVMTPPSAQLLSGFEVVFRVL